MSRYGSGRKYANAVADRLLIDQDLFVEAMLQVAVRLTAFDKFNDDNAPIDRVTKDLGNACLKGLHLLVERDGETPELTESIQRLEAARYSSDRA